MGALHYATHILHINDVCCRKQTGSGEQYQRKKYQRFEEEKQRWHPKCQPVGGARQVDRQEAIDKRVEERPATTHDAVHEGTTRRDHDMLYPVQQERLEDPLQ